MTTAGGIGHTLPYLIPDFHVATTVAVGVVLAELTAISFVRNRYMDTPFFYAALQVMLGGAHWAVEHGYGEVEDLAMIEEHGCINGAKPANVSALAKKRQRGEMGTLGSGNHYLEVQRVAAVLDRARADAFGLLADEVVVSIHCGSRGLGHQVCSDYLAQMGSAMKRYGISLPDRQLACVPIQSPEGQAYLGAMRSAAKPNAPLEIRSYRLRHAATWRRPGTASAIPRKFSPMTGMRAGFGFR